ncbi:uncharacterized protein LOC119402638 [Rhipicephalus sanguineus]|uniref:uncharacterized protein LOC119402638 n=1 Tax=Rhipicephalus sanguineus TaxID=34632 RepID=UPI0018938B48|nr:uncharacterized protein LOC119402638 [Rhipicephalus sanguineus]
MAMQLIQKEGGWYLGVRVNDNVPVQCLIRQGNGSMLERCVNCNFVTEWFWQLKCRHRMCECCFQVIVSYVCTRDETVTKKQEVAASARRYNADLAGCYIECPECPTVICYRFMKAHLEENHAGILKKIEPVQQNENLERNHSFEDQPHSERRNLGACGQTFNADQKHGGDATNDTGMEHEEGTPLASKGTCGSKQTEESQRGKVPESQLCPFCEKSWEQQEIEGHMNTCSERVIECPECVHEVKSKDYEDHIMKCTKEDAEEKPDGPPMNSRDVDDDSERRQKVEEIEALKRAIKALEERIENLEKPLKRLIKRLCENPQQRNY